MLRIRQPGVGDVAANAFTLHGCIPSYRATRDA